MTQPLKEGNVYTIYICTEHGTDTKKCCVEAEDIGWYATAEQSQKD